MGSPSFPGQNQFMRFPFLKPAAKGSAVWPADIRTLAKCSWLIGAFLYVRWLLGYLTKFNGILMKDGSYLLGADFINYWAAAKLTLQNKVSTLFEIPGFYLAQQSLLNVKLNAPNFISNNWSYPPDFIFYVLWLGLFSYPVALVLWLAATFAIYAVAVSAKRPQSCLLAVVLALSPATYTNFDFGQNGFLSAGLLVAGLRLLQKSPIAAGIMFGLASFKPQLGLLIPIVLLATGQWRAIISAVLTIIILLGLSLISFGVEPWQNYFAITLPYQRHVILESTANTYYISMMTSVFAAVRLWGGEATLAYIINGMVAFGAIAVAVYAFRRAKSVELRNAVLLTATFFVSPYMFIYDTPLLAAAIVMTLLAMGDKLRPVPLLVLLLAWCMPMFLVPLNTHGATLSPLVCLGMLWVQLGLIRAENRAP